MSPDVPWWVFLGGCVLGVVAALALSGPTTAVGLAVGLVICAAIKSWRHDREEQR